MTTTPLPPLPEPNLHGGMTVSAKGKYQATEDGYTTDKMQAYALDARADLDTENQRLRDALEAMQRHVEELCTVYQVPLPQATFDKAHKALESKP